MSETCFNPTEADEHAHLEHVTARIKTELDLITGKVSAQFADVIELKQYLQDSKADMDHVEKVSVRQSIEQMAMVGEHSAGRKKRLQKLVKAPYFGRVDFLAQDAAMAQPVYIGITSFYDDGGKVHLVHDWRAPISSLFYDCELGPAGFDAPEGRKDGELTLKRQYRIEKGKLQFMLETSLNIHDEVLQDALSRAADEKMKNIVATIQRDQNTIIRDEAAPALIIQGAAGSGKTSIALHRIAFLLYRHKESIASKDILIISPNKVFAHYISQVLPELGEEMIKETTMETLATQLLAHRVSFQTFFEQVSGLLEDRDEAFAERIRFKSSPEMLIRLEQYARHIKNNNVCPAPVTCRGFTLETDWVAKRFLTCAGLAPAKQLVEVTKAAVEQIQQHQRILITSTDRAALREQFKAMFTTRDLKTLYREFYEWMERPDLLKPFRSGGYEYADVFPLILLKIFVEGVKPNEKVKHLVVDEMQDYTPIHYRVIAHLFPCNKTILGDAHQSVNPHGASTATAIQSLLPQSVVMVMNKSYRSTVEITGLAQRILRNEHLVTIDRHGKPPDIIACADAAEELARIREHVEDFLCSDHHSMGIICKTQTMANALYAGLKDSSRKIHLLNDKSTVFSQGVILATAHLAKGLEFDRVIVPHASADVYHTPMDRHLLYVACTRAMHRLTLTHTGPITSLLGP